MSEKAEIYELPDFGIEPFIRGKLKEFDELREQAETLSAKKSAIIAELEEHGIDRRAVKFVQAFLKLDEPTQSTVDFSLQLVLRAMNRPIQFELFNSPRGGNGGKS